MYLKAFELVVPLVFQKEIELYKPIILVFKLFKLNGTESFTLAYL